jgi:hypothetical protein
MLMDTLEDMLEKARGNGNGSGFGRMAAS